MNTNKRHSRHVLAGAALLAAMFSGCVGAATIYVNAARPDDTGDGLTWSAAKQTLVAALTQAASGDEIWVAAGTYKPTTGTDRTISFVLKAGVGVYGGFAGTETARAQRNWTANGTTLSGDIGTPGDNSDNCYHVVSASGDMQNGVLDGFTVSGGNANGGKPERLWRRGVLGQRQPLDRDELHIQRQHLQRRKRQRRGGDVQLW
jgi:hypothetical protein